MRTEPRAGSRAAAALLAGAATAAGAQQGPPPAVTLRLGASLGVVATDNYELTETRPLAEVVVQPGFEVRLAATGGRIRGFADYALTGLHYTRDRDDDEVQHALNAALTAELVEKTAWLDLGASVSQQRRSAFGVVSPDPALRNDDLAEVLTWRLGPRLEGRLAAGVDWSASLQHSRTRSEPDDAGDLDTTAGRIAFGSDPRGVRLSWGASLTGNIYDFDAGRRLTEAVLRTTLGWAVDPDVRLTAIAGAETNNFTSARRETNPLYGARVDWQPTPRTNISLEGERREDGTTHSVLVAHRLARSALQYSDTRAIEAPDARAGRGRLGTAYDVLFLQYAAIEPDPLRRRQLVEALLKLQGTDPNEQVLADFLAASLIDQRRQELALSWTGVRQSATLSLARSTSRRADSIVVPTTDDDFETTDVVRQSGAAFNVTHRLTPETSLAFDADWQRTTGSAAAQRTTLKGAGVRWFGRVGVRTEASVGARHARFTSPTQPYEATTVSATLSMEF